jgi:hypothetical protein
MNKRLVHDVLSLPNKRKPVAFIQHGTPDTGYVYTAICPFCAGTIAENVTTQTRTTGDLYQTLLRLQRQHWIDCPAIGAATDLAVEITNVPLHTEEVP